MTERTPESLRVDSPKENLLRLAAMVALEINVADLAERESLYLYFVQRLDAEIDAGLKTLALALPLLDLFEGNDTAATVLPFKTAPYREGRGIDQSTDRAFVADHDNPDGGRR